MPVHLQDPYTRHVRVAPRAPKPAPPPAHRTSDSVRISLWSLNSSTCSSTPHAPVSCGRCGATGVHAHAHPREASSSSSRRPRFSESSSVHSSVSCCRTSPRLQHAPCAVAYSPSAMRRGLQPYRVLRTPSWRPWRPASSAEREVALWRVAMWPLAAAVGAMGRVATSEVSSCMPRPVASCSRSCRRPSMAAFALPSLLISASLHLSCPSCSLRLRAPGKHTDQSLGRWHGWARPEA